MKYLIETFGCQMNVHDSERMAGLLEQAGYEPTADAARRRRRRHQHLQRARARRREALHAARRAASSWPPSTGTIRSSRSPAASRSRKARRCSSARRRRRRRRRHAGDRSSCRCWSTQAAATRVAPLIDLNPYDDVSFPLGVDAAQRSGQGATSRSSKAATSSAASASCRTRAATSGCGRRPTSWPRCARRPAAAAAKSSCSGRSSITTRRPTIRRATSRRCSKRSTTSRASSASASRARIRGTSPTRLLEAMRDLPKVCKHLHLPVQSGSTRVLERDAPALHARELSRSGRTRSASRCPDVALSTDMIVGFPGETDADFEETLSLTAAVRYHSMFSFKYSPRPNTLATKRLPDDVRGGGEDAADRGAAGAAARDSDASCTRRLVGATVDVLVDAASRRRECGALGPHDAATRS